MTSQALANSDRAVMRISGITELMCLLQLSPSSFSLSLFAVVNSAKDLLFPQLPQVGLFSPLFISCCLLLVPQLVWLVCRCALCILCQSLVQVLVLIPRNAGVSLSGFVYGRVKAAAFPPPLKTCLHATFLFLFSKATKSLPPQDIFFGFACRTFVSQERTTHAVRKETDFTQNV